jgi:hypothetical protein
MKKNLIIAFAIGAIISAALIALESPTGYALLSWEMPGITVALFFLGVVGVASPFLGVAIAWAVNTLTYGLVALGILTALTGLTKR